MAAHDTDIQQLRTELQSSRWLLHERIQELEDRFDVPRRIKSEVSAHPMKWAAVALGAGVAAAIAVPWLARTSGKTWLRTLALPAFRLAVMSAAPLLARMRNHANP